MTHVFKKSLMMAALVAAFAVAQAGNAMAQEVVQANIDLDTGEVTLDIGGGIQVFGIEGFAFDNVVAATGLVAIDPIPAFPLGATQGAGTQNDAGGIGVLIPSFLPTGSFNLGNILPGGLTQADIEADFVLRFDGPGNTDPANAVGSPQNVLITGAGPTPGPAGAAIPEPGSLSLLALAGLGAVARRRR